MARYTRCFMRLVRRTVPFATLIALLGCDDALSTVGTDVEVFVTGSGDGVGRVIAPEPVVEIDCLVGPSVPEPGACDASFFDAGAGGAFNLVATANPGSTFEGWSGCTSVSEGECVVEFDGFSREERFDVEANFALNPDDVCNMTFGTSDGYLLCSEDETSCTFYTRLNDIDSCGTRCASFGTECLASVRDQEDTCTPGEVGTCDDIIGDRLCTCSKP